METSVHRSGAVPAGGVVGIEDDSAYRTISVLALVSLALGLVAPLCLMAPLLLAIPLFGVAVATVALRQIAASDGATIGRSAAILGMALCVASVGAMFSRSVFREQLLSRQARAVGIEWLARLQAGDAEGAFKMSEESARSASPPHPGEPPPTEPPPNPLDQFRKRPVVEYLLMHGGHAQVHYERDLEPGSGSLTQYFLRQQYVVSDTEHAAEPINVLLTLQRSRSGGQLKWMVANYQSDQLESAADSHDHGHSHSH